MARRFDVQGAQGERRSEGVCGDIHAASPSSAVRAQPAIDARTADAGPSNRHVDYRRGRLRSKSVGLVVPTIQSSRICRSIGPDRRPSDPNDSLEQRQAFGVAAGGEFVDWTRRNRDGDEGQARRREGDEGPETSEGDVERGRRDDGGRPSEGAVEEGEHAASTSEAPEGRKVEGFQQVFVEYMKKKSPLFHLGPSLLRVVKSSKSALGTFARHLIDVPLSTLEGRRGDYRDLLPCRPPEVSEKAPLRGYCRRAVRARKEWRIRSWMSLILLSLSFLFCGGADARKACELCPAIDMKTKARGEMLSRLRVDVVRYFNVAVEPLKASVALADVEVATGCEYTSGGVVRAIPILLDEVDLPPAEHAAVVDVGSVLGPSDCELLSSPMSWLKTEDEWPAQPPKARVWVAGRKEKESLALRLVKLKMCRWIEDKDVFRANGTKVLAGIFGVPKARKLIDGEWKKRTRFIVNLHINAYLDRKFDDSVKLPHPAQLGLLIWDGDDVVQCWGDDERNCFYLYRLPSEWSRMMCINIRIRGDEIGMDEKKWYFPGLQVVPMGWGSACDVIQRVQQVVMVDHALLPLGMQIQPFVPMPEKNDDSLGWMVYLDNYYDFTSSTKFLKESKMRNAVRRAKGKLGIPLDEAKAIDGETITDVLGAVFCTEGGAASVGVSREKRQILQLLLLRLLGGGPFQSNVMRIVLGKAVYALQFRRELFSILSAAFQLPDKAATLRWLPESVQDELVLLLCLTVMLETDLSYALSGWLSASDASPYGGAAGEAWIGRDQMRAFIRRADFRGAAVRMDDIAAMPRVMRPLTPLDCSPYEWSCRHRYPWTHQQHMNLLEIQAYLLWCRKRSREVSRARRCQGHVLDSYVSCGAIAKGRSSSRRINRLLRRVGATKVAGAMRDFILWTDSASMPMDADSRYWEPKKKKKKKFQFNSRV